MSTNKLTNKKEKRGKWVTAREGFWSEIKAQFVDVCTSDAPDRKYYQEARVQIFVNAKKRGEK